MQPLFAQLSSLVATLLLAALATGCASPLTTALATASKIEPVLSAAETEAAEQLKAQALHKATLGDSVPEDKAFAEVLDQLQAIRAIDPAAEKQLIDDLKKVKPEDYQMVVDAFGTALAYRQQLAAREQAAFAGQTPENEFDVATQRLREKPLGSPQLQSQLQVQAVSASLPLQSPAASVPPANSPAAAHWPPSQPAATNAAPLSSQAPLPSPTASHAVATEPLAGSALLPQVELASNATPVAQRPLPASRPLEPLAPAPSELAPSEPADDAAIVSDDQVAPAAAITAQPLASQPLASASAAGDWHAQLDAAIADLEQTVAPQPTTVAELHDHMRLRTLQLIAGNEKDAYRAIPGASPAQQDYWSKQLFAINAYLNATAQFDEKQRAIAALAPLDDARSRLSELASLRVRNLSFVESVDGFGVYQPSEGAKFTPGQKVMLYAEVENFTSNASEAGYATSLGTSFKVLDEGDRLVDGKQFPDVQDSCRNRRRDFHMQYELALPERIYPGPYKIELTITDHNSGKIGQATLPFEIIDGGPAKVAAAPAAPTKK